MLYVCPEYGDIDCGAITASINDSGDRMIYCDPGFETDYNGRTETYDQVEAIEFDRADYLATFSKLTD